MQKNVLLASFIILVMAACHQEPTDNTHAESLGGTDAIAPIAELTTETATARAAFNPTEMLDAVNAIRKTGCTCGTQKMPAVSALKLNVKLTQAANGHALDMLKQKYFSHYSKDGRTPWDRIKATGYNYWAAGENIAWGYSTVKDVMTGWIKSPGHCKNMMSANFTEIGVAQQGTYWVQDFGRPR